MNISKKFSSMTIIFFGMISLAHASPDSIYSCKVKNEDGVDLKGEIQYKNHMDGPIVWETLNFLVSYPNGETLNSINGEMGMRNFKGAQELIYSSTFNRIFTIDSGVLASANEITASYLKKRISGKNISYKFSCVRQER